MAGGGRRDDGNDGEVTCSCASEVGALRSELDELRAQLQEGLTPAAGQPRGARERDKTSVTASTTRTTTTARTSGAAGSAAPMPRRHLLRTAGAVAAGGAVGALASTVGAASPAAANNGQPMTLGQNNTATTQTTLTFSSLALTQGAYLFVHDSLDPPSQPLFGASALAANAYIAKYGIQGASFGGAGAGVYGVGAVGTAVGVQAGGVGANLLLDPDGVAPPAREDPHVRGHVIEDAAGDLWLCVANGTPGTWRKLGGPTAAGAFHVLAAPVRVYDSRAGSPPGNVVKGQLANGASRTFDARNNGSGVPAGATAVLVNLTVTQTSAQGFLSLFRNGIAWPGTSSINWDHAQQTTANSSVVALDKDGLGKAYVNLGCACDFVVDVTGYWR